MTKVLRRYSRKNLRRAIAAGVSCGVLASVAIAQPQSDLDTPLKLKTDYFGYSASVSARVGYSDNIDLRTSQFKEDEMIGSTFFSGGVITSTPRFTGIALADLDVSYLIDRSDLRLNQNVGGTGTATLHDNWFYFDVSGKTNRQLVGDNARFSSNINAGRDQRADVHSFAASPYLFHRMPDQSSVALRYRFSQVFVDDSEARGNLFAGGFLNDSTSHEVSATYDTGGLFERARFKLRAYGNDTTESGSSVLPDFSYRQGALTAEGEYALSQEFSLSGAVGYDEIETQDAASQFFDDEELSGFFWRAGFTAQPNRRSRVRLEYGERYNDEFIDADIFYKISPRLNFNAGANRSFQTRAQSASGRFRETQTQTLTFAEQLREGEELSARGLIDAATQFASTLNGTDAQTVGVGVTDNAYAGLTGVYDRTQITLSGNYADSDFGFRQIENISGGLAVQHRLSRRLNAYSNIFYRRTDTLVDPSNCEANPVLFGLDVTEPLFDPVSACSVLTQQNGVTNTITGTIGGSYQLYKNVATFAEYSHTERLSGVELLEYNENAIYVGVKLDF